MNEFDDRVRRAMQSGRSDDPPRALDRLGGLLHAHARFLLVVGWIKMVIFVVIAVASAIMFFRAPDTREQIAWASLFVLMGTSMGIMAVLSWIELHRLALMREIKRLELQVARLTGGS